MSEPALSVVIPTYNAPRFLTEAVESVLAQTYTDYELIIIDDGSGPQTREALEPYMERLHYVKQENTGIAGARNRGIKEARGEYIAFLDHDDLWLADKLEKQMARAVECPEAGVIYCDFVNFLDVPGEERELGDPFAKKKKPEGNVLAALFESNFINTLVMLFKKEVFEKAGGFDAGFKLILEYDMALRVAGEYDFARVPEVLARYRVHTGNTSGGRSLSVTQERLAALRKTYENPGTRRVPKGVYKREMASVHLKLAENYHLLGQKKEAKHHFWKAVKYRPFTLLRLKKIFHSLRKADDFDLRHENASGEAGSQPEEPAPGLDGPVAD